MRPWVRWTTGFVGLLITAVGIVATWNVLAPSVDELGEFALDGWMFEGPALVTFGLLLLWTAGQTDTGKGSLEGRGPLLMLQIGLVFLALPAATFAWDQLSGTMASSFAWTFSAFALGVPGVALALTGAALWLWRRLRRPKE